MLFKGDEVPEDFPHRDTLARDRGPARRSRKGFQRVRGLSQLLHLRDPYAGYRHAAGRRGGKPVAAPAPAPSSRFRSMSRSARRWRRSTAAASTQDGRPSGMSLAIFDEAFSKMDGKNQRQMMSFYKKLGLQIIIAAPNEKRVAVLEHIDTVVEVDRIGESARATVVQLKERARAELRAMDPDLLSDDRTQEAGGRVGMARRFTDARELLGDLLDRYEGGTASPIGYPDYSGFRRCLDDRQVREGASEARSGGRRPDRKGARSQQRSDRACQTGGRRASVCVARPSAGRRASGGGAAADCLTGSICRVNSSRRIAAFARHGIEGDHGKASPRRTSIVFGLPSFWPRRSWKAGTVASTTGRFPASSPATARPWTRLKARSSDC